MKNNKRIAKIICSLCLWSLVLLCIVPFIWMVSASFKREADIFAVPFRLIPDYLNLQNFKEVWFGKYSYSLMFLNSAKVTLLSVCSNNFHPCGIWIFQDKVSGKG